MTDEALEMETVLATEQGRAFVYALMASCSVFSASFTGDPLTSAFNEGRRHIGIRLFQRVLDDHPARFNQMQAEHIARLEVSHVRHTGQGDEDSDE